jgi:hypothetical protein
MTIRCPYSDCKREVIVSFDEYRKGSPATKCPCCHRWIEAQRLKNITPRDRPHMSKKDRRREREKARAEAKATLEAAK